MNNPLEIVICTEKGQLEKMSMLLVDSLRTFGGPFKNVPITSYQPRKNFPISSTTKKFFEANAVEHIDVEINRDYVDYIFANKFLAAAYHERNSKAENIAFLDSDILFFKAPEEFLFHGKGDVAVRSVGFKNIGSSGPTDATHAYWLNLYNLLGNTNPPRWVVSTVDQIKILEYYNAGHIVSKRSTGLYTQWEENFKKVWDSGLRPQEGLFYLEQSVFGATIAQLQLDVNLFSTGYNYPVYLLKNHEKFTDHPCFMPSLEGITTMHYHKVFEGEEGLNLLKSPLFSSPFGLVYKKMIESHKLTKETHQGIVQKVLKAFGRG